MKGVPLLHTGLRMLLMTAVLVSLFGGPAPVQLAAANSGYVLSWELKTPMPTPAVGAGVAIGPDGRIYSIGGTPNLASYTDRVQAYDPNNNTWQVLAPIPIRRGNLGATTVDGRLYAIGGYNGRYLSDVKAYDPASNTWTQMAPMPTPRYLLGVVAAGGLIYAMGGRNADPSGVPGDGQYYQTVVEVYDPNTNTWTTRDSAAGASR